MPTYEYRCPRGHEFETFQRISDPPGADCPECGEPAERQLSGGAGLLFKGEGFYVTDYRSEDYRKAAAAEKKGEDGGADGKGRKTAGEAGKSKEGKTSGEGSGRREGGAGSGDSGGSSGSPADAS